ncbi:MULTISPECIES: D-serine ammonia-lyase [Bacillus amyloliquefaciens group]|uniref:D-serine ammonia-lyase n=1 Tax=Bacillus amyloliquefaciens group TaxID=1938374 RepID=UPI001F4C75F5|nr:D-serine ammonia-lyase [Bacillus amyloliquefaciens]UNE51651.1 D-serine ammonia-lyase [Bacillus amyloliquefaciens]
MSDRDIHKALMAEPLVRQMAEAREVFWINPHKTDDPVKHGAEWKKEIVEAEERLRRFAPYIASAFPETEAEGGLIESPLVLINEMKKHLEHSAAQAFPGRLLLKCDDELPISGSIKARGGIYEAGMLSADDDYSILTEERFTAFFSKYSIAVGSTGNLGLSIGIIGAKLGFCVTVHMSSDAKQWKKELLREKGVRVIEYEADYSLAVKEGRMQAKQDPYCYFIDDEHSRDLFLGYAVAGSRVKKQLDQMNIKPDADEPLFVYLPCGVGGGPGGVALALKLIYGEHVHIFFGEPTHSPCMLLGLFSGLHDGISVQDIGLDNQTAADGLAVGRPSGLAGPLMEPIISGCYTADDGTLFSLLYQLRAAENKSLEPSALAGLAGAVKVVQTEAGNRYIKERGLEMENAVHLVWSTGGSMVPEEEMEEYSRIGSSFLKKMGRQ